MLDFIIFHRLSKKWFETLKSTLLPFKDPFSLGFHGHQFLQEFSQSQLKGRFSRCNLKVSTRFWAKVVVTDRSTVIDSLPHTPAHLQDWMTMDEKETRAFEELARLSIAEEDTNTTVLTSKNKENINVVFIGHVGTALK